MKRNIGILLVSSFALVGLAFAQQQPPTGNQPGGGQGNIRAAMEKYRPWFDLSESLSLMQEVDKQKGLEFTKAQVKIGLPTLTDLSKRAALATKDATKILDTLETKFVSAKQLIWMDKTRLAREEERRKRAEARRLQQQGTGQAPNVGALAQGAANGRPAGGFGGGFAHDQMDKIQAHPTLEPEPCLMQCRTTNHLIHSKVGFKPMNSKNLWHYWLNANYFWE